MKITCVGGGPAGLFFAILMKVGDANHDITVYERNPAGQTYGWGVVYWDDLIEELYVNDRETARAISANSFRWSDQIVHVKDRQAIHRGGHGFSISRQRLLGVLAARASDLGVHLEFGREIKNLSELADPELIVVGDGVGSRLRELHAEHLGTSVTVGRNKYIWLGTGRRFDAFTFAFVETDSGWIWFHAYGFESQTSTCVVECSPETWTGLGFDRLAADDGIALLEQIFDPYLDGYPLLDGLHPHVGSAAWCNFRTLTNTRWYHDNLVLIGDAAHTTHFTLGLGTRLALEDAIELAAKLRVHQDVQSALKAYDKTRQAALLLPQSEARYSGEWFEDIPRYISLETPQFFALLRERRSPLLPHMPPRWYYELHRATQEVTVLRKLRSRVGPGARELYSRKRPKPTARTGSATSRMAGIDAGSRL
jgi:2-polyprenyl-6-methoxyphenol hydroxylase-like FAD-dependent oxidoreductase